MYDIVVNSPYSPFILVFGLVFVIPQVLGFMVSTIPGFIDEYTGPFWIILLPLYMLAAFVFLSVAIIAGLMNGVLILFGFLEILFRIFT